MNLKIEKTRYLEVNCEDLDEFINHHFFRGENGFEFVADHGARNDSSHTFNVDGILSKFNKRELKNHRVNFMARAYLNLACSKGLIPAGTYLIRVSW